MDDYKEDMERELESIPVTEGWLRKKAVRTQLKMKWKNRYFKLSPKERTLAYMKKPGQKPILTLELEKNHTVRVANKFAQNEMEVIVTAFTLYAHSIDETDPEKDIRTWVERIQQVIDAQDPSKLGEKRLQQKEEEERKKEEEEIQRRGKLKVNEETKPAKALEKVNLRDLPKPGFRRMVQQRAPPPPPRPLTPPPEGQPGEEAIKAEATDLLTAITSIVKQAQYQIKKCYVWGSNENGKLGIGDATTQEVDQPNLVYALSQTHLPESVDSGYHHGLCLTEKGMVFSWGGNKYGQLGTGDEGKRKVPKSMRPVLVRPLRHRPVVQIACGSYHSLALTYDGEVFAWGDGSFGALGIGQMDEHNTVVVTPTKVHNIGKGSDLEVQALSAGCKSSAAITSDGDCYVWGSNVTGQLGTGIDTLGMSIWEPSRTLIELEDYLKEDDLSDDIGVLQVVLAERFSAWLVNNGVLLICGALGHTDSEFVQKQEDTEWIIFNCDTPHLMEGVQMDTLFRKISAGPDMLVLISKQGTVYSTGRGYLGCLDVDDRVDFIVQNQKCHFTVGRDGRRTPGDHYGLPITSSYGVTKKLVEVKGLPNSEKWAGVSVGNLACILRTVDGRLYGWGTSQEGQLGVGHRVDLPRPLELRTTELDDSHYVSISSGWNFTSGLAKPGTSDVLRERWLARKYGKIWFRYALKREPEKEFCRRQQFNDDYTQDEFEHVLDELAKDTDVKQLLQEESVQNALREATDEV